MLGESDHAEVRQAHAGAAAFAGADAVSAAQDLVRGRDRPFHRTGAQLTFLPVVLVALQQARPRRADGTGRSGRSLRRSARRYSSQRDEFHHAVVGCNKLRCAPVEWSKTGARLILTGREA